MQTSSKKAKEEEEEEKTMRKHIPHPVAEVSAALAHLTTPFAAYFAEPLAVAVALAVAAAPLSPLPPHALISCCPSVTVILGSPLAQPPKASLPVRCSVTYITGRFWPPLCGTATTLVGAVCPV